MKRSMRFDFGKLNALIKGLDDKHVVQVGIFGDHASRAEGKSLTNADIGAIHEYGSFSRHIPMRSFLRMPISVKTKEIIQQASIGARALIAKGQLLKVLERLGIAATNAVQKAFATHGYGQWAPDKPATISRKRSSAPLIDTSQLRKSITYRVVAR